MYVDNLVRTMGKSGQSGCGTSTIQSYHTDCVTMVENRTQKYKKAKMLHVYTILEQKLLHPVL